MLSASLSSSLALCSPLSPCGLLPCASWTSFASTPLGWAGGWDCGLLVVVVVFVLLIGVFSAWELPLPPVPFPFFPFPKRFLLSFRVAGLVGQVSPLGWGSSWLLVGGVSLQRVGWVVGCWLGWLPFLISGWASLPPKCSPGSRGLKRFSVVICSWGWGGFFGARFGNLGALGGCGSSLVSSFLLLPVSSPWLPPVKP